MKNLIIILVMLGFAIVAKAQQDVQFTHYMYNTLSVNPAYAGSKGLLDASLLHRQQWLGIEGAPMTQTFFVHSPIVKENMGVGFSVTNDKVGPVRQTNITGDYSYSLKVGANGKLGLGIKAGLNMFQANIASLKTDQANDQAFTSNPANKLAPNFGFGLFYHTDNFYLGASTPKMLETKIENPNTNKISRLVRHYYIIGGFVKDLNDDWKIKPAFLTKITNNAPVSIDMSVEMFYRNKISTGIMHRLKDSFGVLLGYQFTDQLHTGISYDYTITRLTNYNSGTIEVFLSYDFIFKKEKAVTPRYF